MKTSLLRVTQYRWLILLICCCGPFNVVVAEILDSNTQMVRIRLGGNALGGVDTVIYNAGIPTVLGGFTGVTAAPDTISTNAVAGGSGVYKVRMVTDLNARNGLAKLRGTFTYDSSRPMACITAATCGATTIDFRKISWKTRDNDTLNATVQYDGTANQINQIQTDVDPAANREDTRHRNYFQYIFDNSDLLPAGTYEGTIDSIVEGEF